jgi:gamma-tubulin complex component 2
MSLLEDWAQAIPILFVALSQQLTCRVMPSEWSRFITALESKGHSFEALKFAHDRRGVIVAAGFTDPFELAVIETEWQLQLGPHAPDGARQRPSPGASTLTVPSIPRAAIDAYDPAQLRLAPKEVQDNVIASELLSALLGISGVYISLSSDNVSFRVSEYVPPTMVNIVESVLPIAAAYKALARAEAAECTGQSLVAMALGEVVSEVCTSYCHQIAELEKWSVSRVMPLLSIVSEAQRVGSHLLRLKLVVPDLAGRDATLHGGRLLSHLHEQLVKYTGNNEDERLLSLVLRRSAAPYLRILQEWVQTGTLNDPYAEFFISENQQHAAAFAASTTLLKSKHMFNTSTTAVGNTDIASFDRRFSLNKAMIPAFLVAQGRVSKMVYYSGKYSCLLREYGGALPPMPRQDERLTWTNADDLQQFIQTCYERASHAVIVLLNHPAIDLMGHLHSLKSYFLHGRGDWLVDFLDHADDLLHKSPVQVKAHSIKILLQAAIARNCAADTYHSIVGCSFADTTIEQYVQLSLKSEAALARGSGRLSTMKIETRHCIELLQLETDVQWPLTMILDPITLKHMNNVFRLLLWVKVCERNLHSAWFNRHSGGNVLRAHGIKHQMIQFLRQFQFYATHFVIEPQWGTALGRIQQADSVLMINSILHDFVEAVEHGLVLSNLQRFRSLARVLDMISAFCEIGALTVGRLAVEDAQVRAKAASIGDGYCKALSELASPTGADYPQLVPLLTWIDFSGFYERKGIYRVMHIAGKQGAAEPFSESVPEDDDKPADRKPPRETVQLLGART